jgi:hypothetical protein
MGEGPRSPGGGRTRISRRTASWLVDALAPGRAPGTWERDPHGVPPDLEAAAALHGVEGWVRRRAQAAGIAVPGVEDAVRRAAARHMRALGDLRLAQQCLGSAGLPLVVVKGPALVERLYGSPDLRSYIDLDLLVRPSDLGAAVWALEAAGCVLLDANWPLLQQEGVHELRLLGPAGGAIDLHWSLGKGPGTVDVSPAVDTLLDRAVTWRLGDISLLTLDWADTVVHLAVHAAASGGHRLLWCADLRAALADRPADAALSLATRAGEWRAGPQLHVMLARTRASLGADVPAELTGGLGLQRSWRGLTTAVDRAFPVERQGGGRGLMRLVARSASTTSRASWGALAAKALSASRAPREDLVPDWLLDPDEPRSALHAVGGREGREAFFAAVAAEAGASGR